VARIRVQGRAVPAPDEAIHARGRTPVSDPRRVRQGEEGMVEDFIDGFEAATTLILRRLGNESTEDAKRYLETMLRTIQLKKMGA